MALAAAVERYEIHHPVLDDPELVTWQAYAARAWPTLVVVDPEGYIVAHLSGEGHAAGLESLVEELIAEHEAKGTLHRGDRPLRGTAGTRGRPALPGQGSGAGRTATSWSADSGHHRIVELGNDLSTVVRTFGSGTKGFADGDADDRAVQRTPGPGPAPGGRRRHPGLPRGRSPTPSTTACAR